MSTNNPKDVELDVAPGTRNDDGWTPTTGSNGQQYSYRYSGGDSTSARGAISFSVGGGAGVVNLTLVPRERFQFNGSCITFQDDPLGQLSARGNAPRTRIIDDRCTAQLDARYKVEVTDTTVSGTIPCDPPIRNNPE
jgi:hypothetical protein